MGLDAKRKFWISFSLWIFLVSYLSLIPLKAVRLEKGTDKITHFIFYIPFGVLGYYHPRKGVRTALLVSLFGVNLGLLLELLQRNVSGRSCEVMDFLAGALGVIAGLIGFGLILLIRKKRLDRVLEKG